MKWRMLHFFRIAAWLLFCALPVAFPASQALAGKGSMRLIVAFSPGSALDGAARALARGAERSE